MRKTILITGASSGIGAGMARVWAEQGHDLALTARRLDRLEALKEELESTYPSIRVVVHALDVNDPDQVGEVFAKAASELGTLDRVVVNAGLGKGARIGTGRTDANRETAQTNVLGALAQCEAAMAQLYAQGAGHLVVISSVSAMRGMPGSMATYGATKAFVAHLAEGIRADLVNRKGHDIVVSTIYPGYIASEMNEKVEQKPKGMVDTETGSRALVAAIDAEPSDRVVPAWPWRPVAFALRHLPLKLVRKLV